MKALVLLLAATQLFAQQHQDWTGFYTLATNRELTPTGFKQDAPGEKLNDLITPHLQPWAKARMDATDGIADDTGQVCLPDGIFRYPSMAGRFIWLEERGRILMVFQNINTAGVRRIYLDQTHPKNLPPTWNGHSIAHWKADTLEVDTVGFNDKSWLFGGMQPHTEEAHLIERMRPVANGAFLEINITSRRPPRPHDALQLQPLLQKTTRSRRDARRHLQRRSRDVETIPRRSPETPPQITKCDSP